jgi:coronin-7
VIKQIETKYVLQHAGKITLVLFHPTVPDILFTAEKCMDKSTLHVWDMRNGNRVMQWTDFTKDGAAIMDLEFDTVGNLAAVTSTDGFVRVVDVREKKVLLTFECPENKKNMKVLWINNDSRLLTLGFAQGSVRKFSVWDLQKAMENQNEQKEEVAQQLRAVYDKSFGVSNAIPMAYYDGDANLLYICSVADRRIQVFEMLEQQAVEMTGQFRCADDILGIAFVPKWEVDVRKVEIDFMYKLSREELSHVSWTVPRKRREYFQEDLYPDTLDLRNQLMSPDDWFDKKVVKFADVPRLSLKPADIQKLCDAPPEELSEHQQKRESLLAKMMQEKQKEQPRSAEQAFEAFSRMVADAPAANRWDAQAIESEVAEDEWSD